MERARTKAREGGPGFGFRPGMLLDRRYRRDGCLRILQAGGMTLGQDEGSSVIYGMNKAAFEAGAIRSQFSADELPGLLRQLAI